jgi:hypothetical protein
LVYAAGRYEWCEVADPSGIIHFARFIERYAGYITVPYLGAHFYDAKKAAWDCHIHRFIPHSTVNGTFLPYA